MEVGGDRLRNRGRAAGQSTREVADADDEHRADSEGYSEGASLTDDDESSGCEPDRAGREGVSKRRGSATETAQLKLDAGFAPGWMTISIIVLLIGMLIAGSAPRRTFWLLASYIPGLEQFAYSPLRLRDELLSRSAAPFLGFYSRRYHTLSETFFNASISVIGLLDEVEVFRDHEGIPHIFAKNVHDAIFAQGFMQATERPWQLESLRRVASGRLSEVFGPRALSADVSARILGHCPDALPGDGEDISLEAFAAGITAGLHALPVQPVEFAFMKYDPNGEWTVRDTLCVSRMVASSLTRGWSEEYSQEVLRRMVRDEAIIQELAIPSVKTDKKISVSNLRGPGPDAHSLDGERLTGFPFLTETEAPAWSMRRPTRAVSRTMTNSDGSPAQVPQPKNSGRNSLPKQRRAASSANPAPGAGGGSNAFAVGGQHTKSGKPLLVTDPHLPVTTPGFWYPVFIAVLNADASVGYDRIVGAGVPGMPGVFAGHNEHMAWGPTVHGVDKEDLFEVKLESCPGISTGPNPTCYLYDNELYPLIEEIKFIEVKGVNASFPLNVRSTHHGPLVSDAFPLLRQLLKNDTTSAFALASATGRSQYSGEYASGFFDLKSPKDLAQLLSSEASMPISTTFTFASADGQYGTFISSGVPRRTDPDSNRIRNGTSSDGDWNGILNFSELPHVINPPEGFVFTANQPLAQDAPQLGESFAPSHRATRLEYLLKHLVEKSDTEGTQEAKVDATALERIMTDQYSAIASAFRRALALHVIAPDSRQMVIKNFGLLDLPPVAPTRTAMSAAIPGARDLESTVDIDNKCLHEVPEKFREDVSWYVEAVLSWNSVVDPRSAVPSLYEPWLHFTGQELFNRTESETVAGIFFGSPIDTAFMSRMQRDTHWPDILTKLLVNGSVKSKLVSAAGGSAAVLCRGLMRTLMFLQERYSLPSVKSAMLKNHLKWGDVQQVYAPHSFHHNASILRRFLSGRAVRNVGGDSSTILPSFWSAHNILFDGDGKPLNAKALRFGDRPNTSSFRMVADPSDWSQSKWSIMPGVSGWATSQSYQRNIQQIGSGRGTKMPWDIDEIHRAAKTFMRLLPEVFQDEEDGHHVELMKK